MVGNTWLVKISLIIDVLSHQDVFDIQRIQGILRMRLNFGMFPRVPESTAIDAVISRLTNSSCGII